jgi:hypothetical protein
LKLREHATITALTPSKDNDNYLYYLVNTNPPGSEKQLLKVIGSPAVIPDGLTAGSNAVTLTAPNLHISPERLSDYLVEIKMTSGKEITNLPFLNPCLSESLGIKKD